MYSCADEIGKIKERIECYISNTKEENFTADISKLQNKYEITDLKGNKIDDLDQNNFRNNSN